MPKTVRKLVAKANMLGRGSDTHDCITALGISVAGRCYLHTKGDLAAFRWMMRDQCEQMIQLTETAAQKQMEMH
jgi:hypothetical protein